MKSSIIGPARSLGGMAFSRNKWVSTGLWFSGLGVAAALAAESADGEDWWLHGAWCLCGLLIAGVTLWRAMRRNVSVVITDHLVMFTAAFSVYFLFGASFLTFGPEAEVSSVLSYYEVDAATALRTNAVNGIGFGIALIVAAFSPRGWFFEATSKAARHAARIPAPVALAILLAFGACAHAYTLLYDFGFREGLVPGVIRTTARVSDVGIFLAASYKGRYRGWFRGLAVLLAVVGALAGVLLYNKTQIVIPLAALFFGIALIYRPKIVMPLGMLLIATIYIGSSGMVLYARNSLDMRSSAPIGERFDVAIRGLEAARDDDPLARSSAWGRFSYATAQGAAMDFYDRGLGASDFSLIPWLFVPRALVPDKPEITKNSREFHYAIAGNEASSTGMGVFSSGYYSGGWLGVVAASALAGWILAQTSAVASAVIGARGTVLLPFALFGVHIAFRIDGSFLADYAGAFVFLLYAVAAFWLFYSRRPGLHVR
jgi:hypothetical protein